MASFNILSPNDLFEVKRMSLIADYDKDTIFNLYQPIIGAIASALYMSLICEAKNERITSVSTHEQLLVRMQIGTQDFLKARGYLEAVGLLKTYVSNISEEVKSYEYRVYAPKTPDYFFDNALLYGMLIKSLGEKDAARLKSIYYVGETPIEGTEISKSFGEVFHPDFADPVFKKALDAGSNKGRKTAKIDTEFNYDRFFKELDLVSQINKTALTKAEIKEVERLCALYGVKEEAAANVVAQVYDPTKEKGQRLDRLELSKILQDETNYNFLTRVSHKEDKRTRIDSNADLASKINLMESVSPKEYLSILQNGSQPASSDLNLIDSLSYKFRLTPAVINALIDFVLATKDNTLPKSYTEKIAASLAREGVTTAIDAMNFLKKTRKNAKKKSEQSTYGRSKISSESTSEDSSSSQDGEEEVSWDDLLDELNKI